MRSQSSAGVLSIGLGLSLVFLAGCGGGATGSNDGGGNSNPTPVIASLSPAGTVELGSGFTLTITGSGFISTSQVQWRGANLATTYQSSGSLQAVVPASDLSTVGSFDITVTNAAPGGGTSVAVAFTVGDPVPVLTSISPNSAASGSSAITLTVNGSNFVSNSLIQWNGTALATTYVSATQLTAQIPASDLTGGSTTTSMNVTVMNPTPDGGTSSPAAFSILANSTSVVSINLAVNALVWDSTHATLYASLPSSDANGNSIVEINPVTASVGTPQAAGSEPRTLALSSDNSFLYVGLGGIGKIERFSLPGLTLDNSLNLTLPSDPTFGQQVAISLAVAPGQPHTFAAILGNYSWGPPDTGGTVLYDDASPGANVIPYYDATDSSLTWGASSSVLYANDGYTTGNELFVLSADATGLTMKSDYGYLVPTSYGQVHFDPASGHLYVDGGRVVDPATGNAVASFNTSLLVGYRSPLCALDLANGVVFFLGQTSDQFNAGVGVTIEAFDSTTYKLLATLPVPQATGYPVDFVRWGNAGLAFHTSPVYYDYNPSPGPIFLVDGAFVNPDVPADSNSGSKLSKLPALASISPQSALSGSGNLTLTVTGTSLASDSVVTWNGVPLQTSVTSATQLQAIVPLADLSSAGTAIVSITDASSNLPASTSLAFTVIPANAGTTNVTGWNFASLDVAWDPQNSTLVVPVWSADPVYANSILEINPTTGAITNSTSVAADPDLVRVTGDGANLYVGFKVVNSVNELTLPALAPESSWSLGYDPAYGPYYAWDVEPAPGASQTTAVAFAINGASPPETNGMTVYDSGVARANSAFHEIGFQRAQWSSTAATLYAADNIISVYTYGVDSSGLTLDAQQQVPNIGNIHFDAGTGYLYGDGGQVVDPATHSIIGNFNASGMTLPDSSLNRVFILGQLASQVGTSNYTIQSFDQTKFTSVGSITLNSLVGVPVGFVRWGSNGLALVTYNQGAGTAKGPAGMLYIVSDSTFVSAEAAAASPSGARVQSFAHRQDVLRGLSTSGASRFTAGDQP